MADQAPLKATFFAFQKREPGGVLVKAGVAFTVAITLLAVVFAFALIAILGTAFWSALGAEEAPPPMEGVGRLLWMIPLYFAFIFGIFVLLAALESGCLRWMVGGKKSRPFGLDFGKDMWRAYGTYWFWLVYTILGWISLFALTWGSGLVGGIVLGANGGLLAAVMCLAYLIAWLYTTVRLAPATASSIAIGAFAPLKAWAATRGRFWPLLGAFLLLFILYIIFIVAAYATQIALFYGPAFQEIDWSLARSDSTAFSQEYNQAFTRATLEIFTNPGSIAAYVALLIISNIVAITFYILTYGINERAALAALEEGKITPA